MHAIVSLFRIAALGILAATAFSCQARAAVQVDDLFANHSGTKSRAEGYRFPVVKGGNHIAMQRINDWLQVSEYGTLPGHPLGLDPTTTTSLDFNVTAQTTNYLSLQLNGEYMGAYPSSASTEYSFDLRTGDLIALDDLFTRAGLLAFRERVRADRLRQMDGVIASLKHHPSGANHDLDDEKLGFYTDCQESLTGHDLTNDQLSLREDDLVLSMENCANHANLALDDLFNYDSRYSFSTIKPWLNDYGHCLLIDRKSTCVNAIKQPSHGVLRGTIDTHYPITLIFGSRKGNNGYFYDKYGELIPLDGGPDDVGGYRFTEQLKDGSTATISFKRRPDGSYIGSWTQEKTGKTMAVNLL
ncbi:hypothetical protein WJ01_11140 [Burkholderia vietnamiensis]|uniref:hypothetical protein n=1 Tax=Burkholderia vietnamiensis TaxID=60552 RepID=UPI0007572DC8|nr:hypothetical protein [Burkholderia vietnamiensis]KVE96381.1 hypothetical protein WJ01_11140 [Burkholderia vietnamiensis]